MSEAITVPEDIARALSDARVRTTFDEMAPSHRREWLRAIEDAKKPETRMKRIADCVAAMRSRPDLRRR